VKPLRQVFGSYDIAAAQPSPGTSNRHTADGDVVFAGGATTRVRSP
jgi:hypothetical protein